SSRDEQRLKLAFAERAVRGVFAFDKGAFEFALRRVDGHSPCRNVEPTFHICSNSARDARYTFNNIALARGVTCAVPLKGHDGVAIRIRDVQRFAVRGKCDSIRSRLPARDRFNVALRSDLPDPVELEFPVVVGAAECGVREVYMPVFADDDVIWGVELFALIS